MSAKVIGQDGLLFDIRTGPPVRSACSSALRPLLHKDTFSVLTRAWTDCLANARYSTLRFPRIVKVHHDRSVDDAVAFTEYQSMAEVSCGMVDHDENEYRLWLAKLGYENIASESEAVTTPPTNPSQNTESLDEDI